jgi:hypothetical protein
MLAKVWDDITASLCSIEKLCQQLYDEYFTLAASMESARDIIKQARESNNKCTNIIQQAVDNEKFYSGK